MEDRFDGFLKLLLKLEGHDSNHPCDKGGHTRYGITERTFLDWCKKCEYSAKSIDDLDYDLARKIYYFDFFLPVKFTDDEVAHYLLFDLSVNSGFRNYRRCVQEVHDPNNYFEVLQWRRKFYRDIVKADATQKVFLKGWIGRLCDIADHFKVQP